MTLYYDYDDDDPSDERAARVLRRFRADLDRATTPDAVDRATKRLLDGLDRARATHASDDD